MKLSSTSKIILGVLTILQLFAGLGIVVWVFARFLPKVIAAGDDPNPELFLGLFGGIVLWTILLSLFSTLLLVFYLIHAGTNKQTSTGVKILWIFLILIFNGLAEIVYFFLEVLPEKSLTAKLEN
ncbi:MAG: hypothetical protein MK086_10625 [Flavobacteriales bacterium]|nr:hypothetical protein [Flavobacteriales bacterium]